MSLNVVSIVSVGHADAVKLVALAIEQAEQMGIAISTCVVDATGRVKSKLTMDNASIIADELVEKKAKTALLGMTSQEFGEIVGGMPEIGASMLELDQITLLGGGFPLVHEGSVVGAFAVGGATVEQDIACAQAVLDKFMP